MDVFKVAKKHEAFFTEDGIEELESLDEKEVDELIKKIKEEKPLFIDKNFVKSVKKPKVEITELLLNKKALSIQEFIETLHEYFDYFAQTLERKMNPLMLVSIASLKEGYYSVIGMIKELKEREKNVVIELEDKTGSVKCVADKRLFKEEYKQIFIDEVIGVEGKYEKGVFHVKKIVFPEVREPEKIEFTKNAVLYARCEEDCIKIFINGKLYPLKAAFVSIDSLKLLVFNNPENLHPKIFLKKSTLYPGKINLSGLIRFSPHAFILARTPSYRGNFKGIKIFGLENKEEIKIELKTLQEKI